MHLLQTKPGGFVDDADGIVRVEQTPAPLVILSAADTTLALLSHALEQMPESFVEVRLANVLHLRQHASVDFYLDDVLSGAQCILVELLGGRNYWPYGVEQLRLLAQQRGIPLLLVPGDDRADEELQRLSLAEPDDLFRAWRYLREGGLDNGTQLLHFLGQRYFDLSLEFVEPKPLPKVVIYHPQQSLAQLQHWQAEWQAGAPVVAIFFYRAHLQSGNLQPFAQMVTALQAQGLNPLPLAVASLKDPLCMEVVDQLLHQSEVQLILNTTAFAISAVEKPKQRPLNHDVPVLQVILSGGNRDDWWEGDQGLSPRDVAMNVALPEVDGRIITRAVSFKGLSHHSERAQVDVVAYQGDPERIRYVAELARGWCQLRRKPNAEKHLAMILANYPTRNSRVGNGVGLDTPASIIQTLQSLQQQGYAVNAIPDSGTDLMAQLLAGTTNEVADNAAKPAFQSLDLDAYRRWFATLPEANQQAVMERWGAVENDPMVRQGRMMIAGLRLGQVFIGIQPARGYNLDLYATYHDPDLVPPHAYLAFYFWLRHIYQVDAILHMGKHGNLEWLPGKSNGLSPECWPDLILGPMPHLYPFIVNDPGEGSQAKRRAQAVILDHLIPPMTRAESYGPLQDLERLVDEYYEAAVVDMRRAELLRKQILQLSVDSNLYRELGLTEVTDEDQEVELLNRMDTYLCELKESQIRDGLHIYGVTPDGDQRIDTLVALMRLPVGSGEGAQQSLIRALAADLQLLSDDFDPLDCDMGQPWRGPKPEILQGLLPDSWRTCGDTRERLEAYARQLVMTAKVPAALVATQQVWQRLAEQVEPAFRLCGERELQAMSTGLEGRFVEPGPSGAPSRGRLEVLPTGRNFFSVDVRAIPTPTAWQLGLHSASLLVERYLQEEGDYPEAVGLSVWGTATMRTGGDDLAQAFALMGVKPVWAAGSNRVVDFEILPLSHIDWPRLDVTLRVSGFFRDAFSNVMKLFDAAVKAVSELDEGAEQNRLRAKVLADQQRMQDEGMAPEQARVQSQWRVFGSKPGSYGAGLQGPIDERCWETRADLAEAYVNWGGYAYSEQEFGTDAHGTFSERLAGIDLVMHNQDNREHDLLDSDDYYQFQGGMAAAVGELSGDAPTIYHGDHSNPAAPRIRSLDEEIARVMRSRVVNPKWIAGVQRHGYKGAFEMAATLDYLFAYDATTEVVADYQYEMISEAYLLDAQNRQFLSDNNPHALRDMSERLLEAMQRGMWQEPGDYQQRIEEVLLMADEQLEGL